MLSWEVKREDTLVSNKMKIKIQGWKNNILQTEGQKPSFWYQDNLFQYIANKDKAKLLLTDCF